MPLLEETGGRAKGSVLEEDILKNDVVECVRGCSRRRIDDLSICGINEIVLTGRKEAEVKRHRVTSNSNVLEQTR